MKYDKKLKETYAYLENKSMNLPNPNDEKNAAGVQVNKVANLLSPTTPTRDEISRIVARARQRREAGVAKMIEEFIRRFSK